MREKDFGLVLALGILLLLALISPKKVLIADNHVVSEAQLERGAAVYARVCSDCHGSGRQGAPRPGDRDEWKRRLRKGVDRLLVGTPNCSEPTPGTAPLAKEDFALASAYMIAVGKGNRRWTMPRRRVAV